jgi:hypothetical protein
LVWITVLLSIVGLIKSADLRLFALASVLFFLAQAYSGPYDPWRGRYFCICGIFAAPTVGALMQPRSRLAPRLFLGLMVVLGCISALAAVAFRSDGALLAMNTDVIHTTSIFTEDRITQLTRNAAYLEDPLRKFSRLVPESAAVAVAFPGDTYEYPWFGAHLTRTLLPINSFEKGLQPIPPTADYLLYSAAGISCSLPHDIYLGKDLFLRKLTGVNRYCP